MNDSSRPVQRPAARKRPVSKKKTRMGQMAILCHQAKRFQQTLLPLRAGTLIINSLQRVESMLLPQLVRDKRIPAPVTAFENKIVKFVGIRRHTFIPLADVCHPAAIQVQIVGSLSSSRDGKREYNLPILRFGRVQRIDRNRIQMRIDLFADKRGSFPSISESIFSVWYRWLSA